MTRMYIASVIKALRRIEKLCCQSDREDLPPAAQWLRDNARALYSAAQGMKEDKRVCKGFKYRRLHAFCEELVQREAARLDARTVYRAVEEKQNEQPFTVRELRALPHALMLQEMLFLGGQLPQVEKECRQYAAGERLAGQMSTGATTDKLPEAEVTLCRAMEILTQSGNIEAARRLEAYMRAQNIQPQGVLRLSREKLESTAKNVGCAVDAIKALPRIDWDRMGERLSVACTILAQERTFRRMDGGSRAMYLTQVMRLSERCGVEEARVCEAALKLCEGKEGVEAEAGYYLMENTLPLLQMLCQKAGVREACQKHALKLYIAALCAGAALFLALGVFVLPWYGVLPFALVGVQLAQRLFQRLCARLKPPRRMPRLQKKALAQQDRYLVVIPTILMDRRHTLRMVRQLSVLYLANRNMKLDFMLLSDFTDADAEITPFDRDILDALRMGIEALNDTYGTRFHCLHRRRVWDAGENRFIGSERKRGALLMLNRLLCGEKTAETLEWSTLSPEQLNGRYRCVITLDADTFLPAGAAEKLICTLQHPLQKGRVTVLQPRMVTLPMHVQTRAQEALGGCSGADGYDGAAADFYQDVFARGTFMGKGVYEPKRFLDATRDLPVGRILSHDLLEGELASARLAGNIACYDGHPRTVSGFLRRAQRWTRGDWQLLPCLKGNKLDALSKLKVLDNLRLSLMPLMRIIALIASAAAGAYIPFVLAALPLRSFQALWQLCLLPASAMARVDGIVRALWRMCISHKRLLEWTTAAQADRSDLSSLREALFPMLCGAALLLASAFTVHVPGFLLGALWLFYPVLLRYLDAPVRDGERLSAQDRDFLRSVARDTLAFFRAHVNERTHDLPPDNVQLSPPRGAAMRTSPTNIGMYMLSLCAARKMELIDSDEMLRCMEKTISTLEKLPKWHGNLYNWYDIETLQPLHPLFVSAVDSGNCCICLTAAAQCARRCMQEADAALRDVPLRLDMLCAHMKLKNLYDRREDLFYIGYDAERKRMTEGHYDMMASEALLLSYAAIAGGQIGEKHWWRLDRTWTQASGGKTLLSWGGTMFEYLLPALLLPSFRYSALHAAQRGCVQTQMRSVQDGLFGISEAGYAQFDENLNYAYKAFGIRELSLNGNCTDTTRAPYAAALALLTHPQKAAQTLKKWKSRGVYGTYGFFESEDYAAGDPPRIVCSHMAHHQGMILCAVCNALHENYLPMLLFSLPRMRAHVPLLNERAPGRVRRLPRPLQNHRDEQLSAPLHVRAQAGLPPEMHVLSGQGTTLMQAATGHSRISRGELLLTRFDPFCGAVSGPQLYLHAMKEQKSIRLTAGDCLFSAGDWRVTRNLGDLRAVTGGCVDPLTGAVIYRVKIRNLSDRPCRVEATMYLEPALETMKKDSAHMAFSNLFMTVEKTGNREMTVHRRLREHAGGERSMRLRVLSKTAGPMLCMNDRSLFIGRRGNIDAPRGLTLPEEAFCQNDTAEPCVAVRLPVFVQGGREETLYFALGMEELPENEDQAARAFSLCAARAQVMQRMLKMDARQTALGLRLAARMVLEHFPQKKMLESKGVRALWAQGVSGDQPFLLLTAQNEEDMPVIVQTAHLAASLFEHGVPGEMILLLPEENDYEQRLRAGCEALLLQPALRSLRGRARILLDTDEDFRAAALSLCAVHIDAQKPLRNQLQMADIPPTLLPGAEGGHLPGIGRLLHYNNYGGFLREGGYVIMPPEEGTPAPWSHMLCNDQFGTLVCEQGLMYSHMGNSRLRRITKSGQDSVLIAPAEEYFLAENGRAWSLTEGARVTYEPGAAIFERAMQDLTVTLTCFTDAEHPAGMRLMQVKNTGKEPRNLSLFAAARFALGEDGRGTYVFAQENAVHARCGGMEGEAFFCLAAADAHTVSEGAYAPGPQLRSPQAKGEGAVGVLQLERSMQPGETWESVCMLGFGEAPGQIEIMKNAALNAKNRLRQVRGEWDGRLHALRFFLPDEMLSQYLNGFLPYQIRASRLMLRAGFYQSGGAYGFRDQLQDMLPLVYTEPERVRAHLLLCASRQYTQGDVQHWWHPYGAGVRTRISDDLLFLPYVTARYVYVTGDREVLSAHAPYLRSMELTEHEHDRYETAEVTHETGTLMEHCLKAIRRVKLGAHGIPLMGGGDWNDGMDRVGGESAWLGFFLLMVLRDFAPLCEETVKGELEDQRRALQSSMQAAWNGKWFLRAWYEDGRSIGAADSEVPRIDLISQCFAAFAQMPRAQVTVALDAAWEYLHDAQRGITLLMDPPFAPEEKAGYIGAYLPGVRENGGQYTHAVPWFMRALLMNGRRDRAWQLLQEVLPYNHSYDMASARHYRTEPYALSADVYRWGRGGWTWYTGSAAWLYDVFLRDFLGFDKRGQEVTLRPKAMEGWEECTVLYHFGSSRYQLTAARDMQFVTLDGARVRGEYIELKDDGRTHEARFPFEK